jgi:hypothetical protein
MACAAPVAADGIPATQRRRRRKGIRRRLWPQIGEVDAV